MNTVFQIEDKVTTRNSQMYIASQILSPEDMPWNEKLNFVGDIVFNPQCLPTRMTVNLYVKIEENTI